MSSTKVCCKRNENLCSFYCDLQRSVDRMIQVICFKHFFEQACRGVLDKEFEPTEASEISRFSVSDGF